MNAGRLVAQGTVRELQAGRATTVRVTTGDPASAARVLTRLGLKNVSTSRAEATGVPTREHDPPTLVAALVAAGVPVSGFVVCTPTLEELFVELTGEGVRRRCVSSFASSPPSCGSSPGGAATRPGCSS